MNILDPKNAELADIPDDKLVMHYNKSVLSNFDLLVPASGTGMFFFFPGAIGNLLGFHYVYVGGQYQFDQVLTLSQDITQYNDSSRKISQLVTVRSTTVPIGVFALTGTINAIRYDGGISTIPSLTYNGILGAVVNRLDSVAGVLAGRGLAILSLPDNFDQDYVRLNNVVAVSGLSAGAGLVGSTLDDFSDSIQYNVVVNGVTFTTGLGAQFIMQLDVVTAVNFVISVNWIAGGATTIVLTISAVDPFGNILVATNLNRDITVSSAGTYTNTISLAFLQSYIQAFGVISGVQVSVSGLSGSTVANTLAQVFVNATVHNAQRFGSTTQNVVAAYENVTVGSTLTINAVSNFELVPNAIMRANIPTQYGEHVPGLMEALEGLFGHREQLGLRTVWDLLDYQEKLADLLTMAVVNRENVQAADWGGVVRTFKDLALPMLYKSLPEAKLIVDLGTELYRRLRSRLV